MLLLDCGHRTAAVCWGQPMGGSRYCGQCEGTATVVEQLAYYRAVWSRLPKWAQDATARYMEANTKEARG